jgi:galactokinase
MMRSSPERSPAAHRSIRRRVEAAFHHRYGEPPEILVRAPGRVNLIGEHTDYNDGFVLPLAIDRAVWIALRPSGTPDVHVWSIEYAEPISFSLTALTRGGPAWSEFIKGVAWALSLARWPLTGWEGVIGGDIPIGAGLSSSAAVELAAARAFAVVANLPWDPTGIARLAQQAEVEWVGVRCGIMDQMASACSLAGHALLIDCRSLNAHPIPLPPDLSIVILDTGTRRGLTDSVYNERRQQCEMAARYFGVPALREVTLEDIQARGAGLDEMARRRARHVATENARTLETAAALERGEAAAAGRWMDASHESLRHDFEVSSPALDQIVDIARSQVGCYGARMTGAGFGGCAVALVERTLADTFSQEVARAYRHAVGLNGQAWACLPSAGAEVVTLA